MRLTVIGCSPAWPNPGGAHSGYLVENDGGSLLLDCGPGVLARLRTASAWPDLDAIVITHFHLDHLGDLVPWVWGALHRGETRKPDLWVPTGGAGTLEHFGASLGFADMFERVFVVREFAPGVDFAAGGCSITATVVPHYRMESHALRVTAGGRALAYSGDSAPADALVACAREADLFLCEATLESDDLDGMPRGHLSLDEARAAFEASGAADLLVTHRPAELETPSELELAQDGAVYTI